MSWVLTDTCPHALSSQTRQGLGVLEHFKGSLPQQQGRLVHGTTPAVTGVPSSTFSLGDSNDDSEQSHPTPDTSHTTQITLDWDIPEHLQDLPSCLG